MATHDDMSYGQHLKSIMKRAHKVHICGHDQIGQISSCAGDVGVRLAKGSGGLGGGGGTCERKRIHVACPQQHLVLPGYQNTRSKGIQDSVALPSPKRKQGLFGVALLPICDSDRKQKQVARRSKIFCATARKTEGEAFLKQST